MSRAKPLRVPEGFWDNPDLVPILRDHKLGQLFWLLYSKAGGNNTQTAIGAAIGTQATRVNALIKDRAEYTTNSYEFLTRVANGFDMPDDAREVFGIARKGDNSPTQNTVVAATALPRYVPDLSLRTDESTSDILARVQMLSSTNIDNSSLGTIDAIIEDIVERYEREGPAQLAPEAIRVRNYTQTLLAGHQPFRARVRLYSASAKLSGLLGYMSVNRGRPALANAYCTEAFGLAEEVEDLDLLAWIRGTESLSAYYKGDYRRALELARDGQRYARTGPQSIRLAINGEARALGKLGEMYAAEEAVGRAYAALDDHGSAGHGSIIPCISFEPYDTARTAANAATAYLSLGDTKQVSHYAAPVLEDVEFSDSDWSRALVRLDVATAYLVQDETDVEAAVNLAREAIVVSTEKPITSVRKRAIELGNKTSPFNDLPIVKEFREELRTWLQDARFDAPGSGGTR